MLDMCRELGFDVARHPDEPALSIVSLNLANESGTILPQ
jgi:hypothetical protein